MLLKTVIHKKGSETSLGNGQTHNKVIFCLLFPFLFNEYQAELCGNVTRTWKLQKDNKWQNENLLNEYEMRLGSIEASYDMLFMRRSD